MTSLLPRAPWREVLLGAAPLVGSRLDPKRRRGRFSPVEPRLHLGLDYGDLAADERRLLERRSVVGDLATAARASITSLLAPPLGPPLTPRPYIVSTHVDNVRVADAVRIIAEPHREARSRLVFFVHPHALNLAASDPALRERLSKGDWVLPDGIGLRIAGRLLGTPLVHNVNGTDLLAPLCATAAAQGRPLALIGGAAGVAERAAEAVQRTAPGLSIALTSHGFLDEPARRALEARVLDVGPCLVLVGMGSPLQEELAVEHLARLPGSTVVTVGGLFDFLAGRVPRAPQPVRDLGLEWLFRMAQEPRRLAHRYLLGNPLFVARAIGQLTRSGFSGRAPRAP